MEDQVSKVIQGSQDLEDYLETLVPMVKKDFQAFQDKRESHMATALLG